MFKFFLYWSTWTIINLHCFSISRDYSRQREPRGPGHDGADDTADEADSRYRTRRRKEGAH
jgi:hypothetical protein